MKARSPEMSAERSDALAALLVAAGWDRAKRTPLAGDASSRSYLRLTRNKETAILMIDQPAPQGTIPAYLRIAGHLSGLGLSVPAILASDPAQGFVLVEDLGDTLFPDAIDRNPDLAHDLYAAAAEVLLHLQKEPPPAGPLSALTTTEWADSAMLVTQWYAGKPEGEPATLREALARALTDHAGIHPRVLVLRDYHAGNLLWLPTRKGPARVGLLDFQDAQLGQPAYDLVSLLQDARRDVPTDVQARVQAQFARSSGLTEADLVASIAALGALRALRIMGIFARLCLRDGKPAYLDHLPRVWCQLQRNLSHPALQTLREEIAATLPAPTADFIARIRAQCGSKTTL